MRQLVVGTVLALAAGPLCAQQLGDPLAGQRLAVAWCSECHIVSPTGTQPSAARPPSFFTIANRVEVTPHWLAAFFVTPHPVMPNIILQPADRDDLSAYILGLKLPR